MSFTTTWTTLTLWWECWQRYRRRWAKCTWQYHLLDVDQLSFSPVVSGGWWEKSSFTPVPQQPTPISDQCPQGDNSGNFFDWLCTKVIKPPVLRNIPFEHQTAATQPRWQKMFQKLNQPTEDRMFVFPNCDAQNHLRFRGMMHLTHQILAWGTGTRKIAHQHYCCRITRTGSTTSSDHKCWLTFYCMIDFDHQICPSLFHIYTDGMIRISYVFNCITVNPVDLSTRIRLLMRRIKKSKKLKIICILKCCQYT